MEKRHKHVSPTLDIMAKKIFSLPEVTVVFIRDILDLDVVDAQILEGTQLHKKRTLTRMSSFQPRWMFGLS